MFSSSVCSLVLLSLTIGNSYGAHTSTSTTTPAPHNVFPWEAAIWLSNTTQNDIQCTPDDLFNIPGHRNGMRIWHQFVSTPPPMPGLESYRQYNVVPADGFVASLNFVIGSAGSDSFVVKGKTVVETFLYSANGHILQTSIKFSTLGNKVVKYTIQREGNVLIKTGTLGACVSTRYFDPVDNADLNALGGLGTREIGKLFKLLRSLTDEHHGGGDDNGDNNGDDNINHNGDGNGNQDHQD